jgi:hypothetical protein
MIPRIPIFRRIGAFKGMMSEEMAQAKAQYPCPACGFLVFDEGSGSFDICPLCGWEDDDVQLRYPSMTGGANRPSLWQEQQRILERYPLTVREANEIERDPHWRPLKPNEIDKKGLPQTGREYFDAFGAGPPSYYWLQDSQEPA